MCYERHKTPFSLTKTTGIQGFISVQPLISILTQAQTSMHHLIAVTVEDQTTPKEFTLLSFLFFFPNGIAIFHLLMMQHGPFFKEAPSCNLGFCLLLLFCFTISGMLLMRLHTVCHDIKHDAYHCLLHKNLSCACNVKTHVNSRI